MPRGHCMDGGLRRVEPVLTRERVAGDLEVDERRATVLRDRPAARRRLDVHDVPRPIEPCRGIPDRGLEAGIPDRQRLALDEDALAVRPEAGVLQRVLGTPRLTRELIGAVDLVLPERLAENCGDDHEREPSEDGLLPVLCAPVSGAGGEVASPGHVTLRSGGGMPSANRLPRYIPKGRVAASA